MLDGAYFTNLLGDDIVAKSFMPPIAQPGVVEGIIRRLAGFDVYETSILPENGEITAEGGKSLAQRGQPKSASPPTRSASARPPTSLLYSPPPPRRWRCATSCPSPITMKPVP